MYSHPDTLVTGPSVYVVVTVPQLSVPVAIPDTKAISISSGVGLQPKWLLLGRGHWTINTGSMVSTVQLIVLETLAELPQSSVEKKVLDCVCTHPLTETGPSEDVTLTELQLSVAVAEPSASSISAALGLHPRSPLLAIEPVAVMTGAMVSTVQLMVLDILAVLPQLSVAVKVLVCVCSHPLNDTDTGPSEAIVVTGPQLFVAVADPRASSISAAEGLHPRSPLLEIEPVATTNGAMVSTVQLMVLETLALLPQSSVE